MGAAWRSIENLGEYGWWGNGGIFDSWESWVKYGGNMEGVGKCVRVWREIIEGVGRCVGGEEKCGGGVRKCVWGVGRGVRSVLGCGGWGVSVRKSVWGVEKCFWGVGRGVRRVLGWRQCEEKWGVRRSVERFGGAGKCGEKGNVPT